MHFQILTALLLTTLTQARPQTPADTSALAGLPACAQDAANSALGSSGCAANDKDCICSSQPFITAITTAVTQTCTAQDVQAALIFAQTYCGAALGAGGGSPSSGSSAPAATGDGAAASDSVAPTASPSDTADGDYTPGASTTTVAGTVTATTSVSLSVSTVPDASITSMSMSMMHSGVVMTTTQCTTTTTIMTTPAKTMSYNATYTGAAVKSVGQGIMAAVVGLAGAVALL
ncbi:hypothetical protein A1O7_07280 [Cladophialophora yegresii CBS 114405]|uniref:CFEM domain-containing protein n=1 Tax=Cladophialophora yegresii CBS 114405 TaxID=1182544 RepID=W9VXI3_9EURO|nr:uncharacterized protein A1O7_07280 [Cladophialophora yegresii CBS 114405]EXJ56936.1 hypothetical protein A1O7_07280 [Cladophialophora yegresii CBS 114405]